MIIACDSIFVKVLEFLSQFTGERKNILRRHLVEKVEGEWFLRREIYETDHSLFLDAIY